MKIHHIYGAFDTKGKLRKVVIGQYYDNLVKWAAAPHRNYTVKQLYALENDPT